MPELLGTKSNRWLTAMTLTPELIKPSPIDLIKTLG